MDQRSTDEFDWRARLQFQREAARAQRDLAGVVRKLHQLFSDVRSITLWSEEDERRYHEIVVLGQKHIDAWLALSPPVELASTWQELLTHFEEFDGFLDEFHALKDSPPDAINHLFRDFQRQFRAWLHEVNRRETELAERAAECARISAQERA